jgi:hypothetical protein
MDKYNPRRLLSRSPSSRSPEILQAMRVQSVGTTGKINALDVVANPVMCSELGTHSGLAGG